MPSALAHAVLFVALWPLATENVMVDSFFQLFSLMLVALPYCHAPLSHAAAPLMLALPNVVPY